MNEWMTTTTLLSALRTYGNQDAWDRFIGHFRRPVAAFTRRMGLSESEADDATQETLLVFAQRYRDGDYDRERGRLRQWLFGIAYRQALGARSRRRGQARQVAEGGASAYWNELPDEAAATRHWDEEWEHAVLEHCLSRVRGEVNASTYTAFDLLVRQGQSVETVAERLGLSRNAIYNAKHRVLKRARELAREYEGGGEG